MSINKSENKHRPGALFFQPFRKCNAGYVLDGNVNVIRRTAQQCCGLPLGKYNSPRSRAAMLSSKISSDKQSPSDFVIVNTSWGSLAALKHHLIRDHGEKNTCAALKK
jgi:hypothetical protein